MIFVAISVLKRFLQYGSNKCVDTLLVVSVGTSVCLWSPFMLSDVWQSSACAYVFPRISPTPPYPASPNKISARSVVWGPEKKPQSLRASVRQREIQSADQLRRLTGQRPSVEKRTNRFVQILLFIKIRHERVVIAWKFSPCRPSGEVTSAAATCCFLSVADKLSIRRSNVVVTKPPQDRQSP